MSFLNVICLLSALYILVKYHENILEGFKVMKIFLQFLETRGGNSWTVRVVIFIPDTSPLRKDSLLYPLYNLTKFHENSSKGIGVMRCNNASTNRQMDGWTDGFHADSYIPITYQLWDNKSQQKVLMI